MKLLIIINKLYSQKAKRKEAIKMAFKYYRDSLAGTHNLWSALYNDGAVGKRIYYAVTEYVHGLSDRCGYCQDRIFHNKNSNIDHILPASIYPQFTFVEDNLVRVCVTCNMLKAALDFYVISAPFAKNYQQYSGAWGCFHPRHDSFADHVERLVVQTNHLYFRAYLGKTPAGIKLCSSLLQEVSEFEVKATANPVVALAAQKLGQYVQSNRNANSDTVKKLLQTLVANI